MTCLDAAEAVLEQASGPLAYREVTRRVLEAGLWETTGVTPGATLNAQISVDIINRGIASRFQRTITGVFALRRWALPEYVGTSRHNGATAPVIVT